MTWSIDPLDVEEPAHLRDAAGFSPSLRRYAAPPELADVVRRFWVPVWSLPPGSVSVQRVLQYPVCQLVVGSRTAELVGPHSGLATEELSGAGWVVGAMLQPAAGAPLAGGSLTATGLTDRRRDLRSVTALDAGALIDDVRAVMTPDPGDPGRQQEACRLLCTALAALLPIDDEGRLVNAVVQYVEGDPEVRRVGQVCEKFGITERSLQRLTARRVGLPPKWLIQRRRLHDAAERLRAGDRLQIARVAADLGYADQAHFTRDFRAVTGLTPGAFAAEPRDGGSGVGE
ncbi:helix-turn-helix domain-containing protein [Nocardioides sp. SYSU DS0651]|uniref:helix-turn-helix domain-containing protein n=1 Tax=Nocardioides sp. SYSU DS0651 TaxID=3415955 RepID=UPI003F4C5CE3